MFGLISIKDFAKELGVPESTVRTWKRTNEIPQECFKKIGVRVFLKVEETKKWLDKSESDAIT